MKTNETIRRICAITITIAVTLILGATMAGAAEAEEILYLSEGRVYRGEVLNGRPHGEGTLTWPSGAAYSGQWANGTRQGSGTYVGDYRDGERSGHGRFRWPNGRVYEGAWRAGMRHGEGVETETATWTHRFYNDERWLDEDEHVRSARCSLATAAARDALQIGAGTPRPSPSS